ncbi:hypothetical protein BU26DRAFT_90841 [Trematosphaeria pertusa]|uniref:Uncharacterized protein n=1 Tax=Trematosphaeria pertusa TaxID=390896 RepID=A0A6A6I4Q4_9PLEO|nr:uncharacterized protein BU26DRAFT_90841 [Trematosphaeria pertusa]KAF2245008.1 hypothetical protein BU26DRAFT_90841 [Trematosphaeria pertusa]
MILSYLFDISRLRPRAKAVFTQARPLHHVEEPNAILTIYDLHLLSLDIELHLAQADPRSPCILRYTTELPQSTSPSTMKFASATALLFATLALANPSPNQPESRNQLSDKLGARADAPALAPAAAGIRLDARAKKPKPKTGSGNDTDNAVAMLSPSRTLELGALGLGIIEIVRLWG